MSVKRVGALLAGAFASMLPFLGGCSQVMPSHMRPLSSQAQYLLASKGMTTTTPILIRIFKEEHELEIWKQETDGKFHLFKEYKICRFSGGLGPKQREGDRQSPEGFYRVSREQMNPRSREHLSFNVGYPNAYDRALGRTGSNIMVHGGCASIGCFAMTDSQVQDIFILARDAFYGGQESFQIQSYPFRMTEANMIKHRSSKWYKFWLNLKEGYDYFELTHREPKVDMCGHQYLINAEFDDPDAVAEPSRACPAHHKLPIVPFNQPIMASAGGDITGALPYQSKLPESAPLGSVLGTSFGKREPTYHMFDLGPAIRAVTQ